MGFGGV